MLKENLTNKITPTLTPVFLATAVSVNRLCEKDSITAIIVISFPVKLRLAKAPIAAKIFTMFPNTNTRDASPGNPNILITGARKFERICSIPVFSNIVMNIYTGTIILAKTKVVLRPFFSPL